VVEGMNCLHLLDWWDRGFKSYSRNGCVYVRLFCVCVVLCIGSGLATSLLLIQGVFCLCNKDYKTEEDASAQQRAVEPLMNE
jgi:hypothetical protein